MKYTLNERNTDAVCKEAYAFLVRRKTNPKDMIHTKLSIEEVLLTYLSAFGSDVAFSVDYGGGLTKNRIRLTVPGPSLDPFASTEASTDEDLFLSNVLSRMRQRPKWKYARGVNTIVYTPSKKSRPDWEKLLFAIVSAVVLGLASRALPANLSMAIRQDALVPLLDTFLGFLNAVAGPRNSQWMLTLDQNGYRTKQNGQSLSRHDAGCDCRCMAISKVLVSSFSGSYLVRVRMICSSSFLDGFLILFFEELTESSFSSFL